MSNSLAFLFGRSDRITTVNNHSLTADSPAHLRRRVFAANVFDRRVHTYYRTTKSGGVVKAVREHILRNDIACGLAVCTKCAAAVFTTNKIKLPSNSLLTLLCPYSHLIVVDVSVSMHRSEALMDSAFDAAIIPQTVYAQLRQRSAAAHRRAHERVFMNEHAWFLFDDEHHPDVYVEKDEMIETSADRNARLLRRTVEFYQRHLIELGYDEMKVLLLTDDPAVRDAARQDGLISFLIGEYVRSFTVPNADLIDKCADLQVDDSKTVIGRSKQLFPQHLDVNQMQAGLLSGKYKRGSYQQSRDNYLEGLVFLDSDKSNGKDGESTSAEPILVQGLLNCNRAVHGDSVVIEMLPRAQWTCPARVLRIRDVNDEEKMATSVDAAIVDESAVKSEATDDDVDGDALDPDATDPSEQHVADAEVMPTARVVGIWRRGWREYCGVLLLAGAARGQRRYLFAPAERRVPRIRIETRQADVLKAQRIVVVIDAWPRDSRYPLGHYVRSLGALGDKAVENEVLLLEHDVPHGAFSERVLACLPKQPWTITDEDRVKRVDLRHFDICSVDPPGCTDIDDALHCRPLGATGKGGARRFEVGVHIADVSHFVRPHNELDSVAQQRGTSVYLYDASTPDRRQWIEVVARCDRRIDMLPDLLSGNLCSLRGGVERFAFSVIWTLTSEAEIIDVRYCKSIIQSRAALTYQAAQDRIDDASLNDDLSISLRHLRNLASKLRQRRKGAGALTLASMEIRFNLDNETRDPISVSEKKPLDTHWMVEEFMLLANISVAEKICADYPDCAVLRRHPVPPPTNYKPVQLAALKRGFHLNIDSGKALADSLEQACLPTNPFFNTMLRMLTTRCMTQAVYFASGTLQQELYRHFGLAVPIYTHFTSPIRRYADLMVHRLLAASIDADITYPSMLNKRAVEEVCHNLNYRHKQAQYCGRASVLLNTHLFFKDKVEELEGYILSVRRNAIQVLIPKYGLESAIMLEGRGTRSPFVFDDETCTLRVATGASAGVQLQMFDGVRVQLSLAVSADEQHQRLQLKLIEPKVDGFRFGLLFSIESAAVMTSATERDEPIGGD